MLITSETKRSVLGPEEQPKSATTMVRGSTAVYTSLVASSRTGFV